jgi:phytoene synthase
MRFEADRARSYYRESEPLLEFVEPRSRKSLWALRAIYLKLLAKMEASGFQVLSRRIRVPAYEKVGLLLRALAGW